jgi:hypothetical protein
MILNVTSPEGPLDAGVEVCETRGGKQKTAHRTKDSAGLRTFDNNIEPHPTTLLSMSR